MMHTFRSHHILPDNASFSDAQLKTFFSVTGIFSLMLQWHASAYDRTPRQIAELTISLLPRSLF